MRKLFKGKDADFAQLYNYIYSKESDQLDRNLHNMFKFLKPQANHIYYDRKIEYINLVE